MIRVFISHNWADKTSARMIAESLRKFGVKVWIDEAEMKPGDSLIRKIAQGIHDSQFCLAILSRNSVDSPWVKKELEIAITQEIKSGQTKVIPVILDDSTIPVYLTEKLYVDLTSPEKYDLGITGILRSFGIDPSAAKIGRGILLIYTGGGMGMFGGREGNEPKGLAPARIEKLIGAIDWRSKRPFKVDYYTFEKPLDSANMSFEDWADLANIINRRYLDYQGFVVIHGFDTIDYAAMTLGLMLENMDKPVVLTGSKLPPEFPDSNAMSNLSGALHLAAGKDMDLPYIPGVSVYRNSYLIHPGRVLFSSLKESWAPVNLERKYIIIGSLGSQHFKLLSQYSVNCSSEFRFNPSYSLGQVHIAAYLQHTSLKGLASYIRNEKYQAFVVCNMPQGTGSLSILDNPIGLDILKEASNRDLIPIVVDEYPGVLKKAKSVCNLRNDGIIYCNNITPAAAIVKLSILFGRKHTISEIKSNFLENCIGEFM